MTLHQLLDMGIMNVLLILTTSILVTVSVFCFIYLVKHRHHFYVYKSQFVVCLITFIFGVIYFALQLNWMINALSKAIPEDVDLEWSIFEALYLVYLAYLTWDKVFNTNRWKKVFRNIIKLQKQELKS